MRCSCFQEEGKNCIELVPIFSNLSQEEMLEIASITVDRSFDKGQMVYMSGDKADNLYVIHKGRIKITRISQAGKEQVLRILGPGQFMGELSLFSREPLTDNAEVLEDTVMCIIEGKKLKQLMVKYPDIGFKIVEELSQRLNKAENLIENINLYSVEKRLATTLLALADKNGKIRLEMSKRDLASQLGMSQETLSRQLSSFQDLGLIGLRGQREIIIEDSLALEEIL